MIHGKNQRIRAFIKHFSIRPPRARDGAAAPPTHHPNILSRPHDIASFRWPHMLPLSPDRDVTRPAATILSSRRPSLKACPSSHRRTPQSSNHCVQKYSYQEFTFFPSDIAMTLVRRASSFSISMHGSKSGVDYDVLSPVMVSSIKSI